MSRFVFSGLWADLKIKIRSEVTYLLVFSHYYFIVVLLVLRKNLETANVTDLWLHMCLLYYLLGLWYCRVLDAQPTRLPASRWDWSLFTVTWAPLLWMPVYPPPPFPFLPVSQTLYSARTCHVPAPPAIPVSQLTASNYTQSWGIRPVRTSALAEHLVHDCAPCVLAIWRRDWGALCVWRQVGLGAECQPSVSL